MVLNFLPNDRNWPQTKLKAFADDKFGVAKMLISLVYMEENIVGKRENAGYMYQHFLFFPQCFQKTVSKATLKLGIVW